MLFVSVAFSRAQHFYELNQIRILRVVSREIDLAYLFLTKALSLAQIGRRNQKMLLYKMVVCCNEF